MLHEQRARVDPRTVEPVRLWDATAEDPAAAGLAPTPTRTDWYVVIDDLADGRVVFDAAPWPSLDRAGRLAFRTRRVTRTASAAAAQERLDAARRAAGQEPRPLRIGDAFLVRGPRLARDLAGWRVAADVTRQARDAAKRALFAAVAPSLEPEEEARLPDPEPPGEAGAGEAAGGQAFPAV